MLFSLIYCFFLVKLLKFQKMSDWNELSSIVGKRKFCRIYWQWILIEQTFLYTVVYRTFLYNPTNLKVPKKAPWLACKCYRPHNLSWVAVITYRIKHGLTCARHPFANLWPAYSILVIAFYKTLKIIAEVAAFRARDYTLIKLFIMTHI